jgi:hypothetical protein
VGKEQLGSGFANRIEPGATVSFKEDGESALGLE